MKNNCQTTDYRQYFFSIYDTLNIIQYTWAILNFTILAQYILYNNKIISYIKYILYNLEKKINIWAIPANWL